MNAAQKYILIGHPLGHSCSPAIHGAAYRALGLPHRYELRDCPDEASVRAQLAALRTGGIAGANVTVPWKRLAFELADDHAPSARSTGVANVLAWEGGRVVAHNTDTVALERELRKLSDRTPACAWVIGAGGAAQAAVVALLGWGVGQVSVTARGWTEAQPRASWKRAGAFERLGAQCEAWPAALAAPPESLCAAQALVQATSAGMQGASPGEAVSDWIPWSRLPRGACAYDVVYNPPLTPFLARAAHAGLAAAGGLGMLVRQAAAALEIWVGEEPPFDPLHAAAQAALSRPGAVGSRQSASAEAS